MAAIRCTVKASLGCCRSIMFSQMIFSKGFLWTSHSQSQFSFMSTKTLKPISVSVFEGRFTSKNRSRKTVKSRSRSGSNDGNDEIWGKSLNLATALERMEEAEDKADSVEATLGRLGGSLHTAKEEEEQQIKDLIALNRRVRFKTIERKYFRKLPSPNLLTWAAKEQMRYLHNREEWTAEELADHFPVSMESVLKILKSRVRLHRDENIRRHDSDVRNNWLKIKSDLESGGKDLSESVLEGMLNSDKDVITNAAGTDKCPLPTIIEPPKPRGPFTMIVKDCLDEKLKEHREKEKIEWKARVAFSQELEEISKLLSEKYHESERQTDPQSLDAKRTFLSSDLNEDSEVKSGIDVSRRQGTRRRANLVTYQKGRNVYDGEGEFLYRIP